MSDVVTVESIKDALAECPICTEYFNHTVRIPRRMPCCLQSMCEPCLETCSEGRRSLSCPLCRQHHNLPDGVKSLPKEMLILRFLDVLKTQSNAVPSCTDCPDNNAAMARCDTCSIYLCQPCLTTHTRNTMSRDHRTSTFEDLKHLRAARPISAFGQRKMHDTSELKKKLEKIEERIDGLSAISKNIEVSRRTSQDHINKTFDELIAELQQRRGILLSQVESNAEKENKAISRAIASHKTFQHKLQKGVKSQLFSAALQSLLVESPDDVDFDRRGINFLSINLQEATAIIRATGLVRTITFTCLEGPAFIDKTNPFHSLTLDQSSNPEAPWVKFTELSSGRQLEHQCSLLDQVILLEKGPIVCPHLEYDHSTASEDVKTEPLFMNKGLTNHLPNTGCRIQSSRSLLLSKPFSSQYNKRCMYQVKVNISLKEVLELGTSYWGIWFNVHPADTDGAEFRGFRLEARACNRGHEHANCLCLSAEYNDDLVFHETVLENEAGAACNLDMAIVMDTEEDAIHVLDAASELLLGTVSGVAFDQPLWTLMFLGGPVGADVKAEIISGNKINVNSALIELLNTL